MAEITQNYIPEVDLTTEVKSGVLQRGVPGVLNAGTDLICCRDRWRDTT